MTRTDTFVVGTLVLLLAIVAGLIGVPALQPASTAPSPGTELPEPDPERPYVEGVLGRPVSVSPLTARSQADRDLVALLFSGLVRLGPGGAIVPDLARRWSVDADGRTWTVELVEDATWHDGEPVTADDVVFTIDTLKDPEYTGPAASSWREVTVRAASERTVVFTLETPLGGFLQALTQPIAPAHLLGDVPVDGLADDPFTTLPVGSGPFVLAELTETSASLVPAASIPAPEPAGPDEPDEPGESGSDAPDGGGGPGTEPSAPATDSLASARPTLRPVRPRPYLPGIEFRFFDDPSELAAAYRAGEVDAASGLPRQLAAELGTAPDSRLLRYPGATLTTVLLNQRPDHPEFRAAAVRTALLAAIDRGGIIVDAYADAAGTASGPISASSPLFDAAAGPPVAYSRSAARKALRAADWTEKEGKGWFLPGASKPLSIELLSPEEAVNPGAYRAAAAVTRDWTRIGLTVKHLALPPGEFVSERLAKGTFQAAVADVTIGLDPDLYPLLASSQTLTGGSNVMGVQDPTLDDLLRKARAPGTAEERAAAYAALQRQLAAGRYLLPLAFADEVVVVRDTVRGPVVRQVGDPSDRFWDVLTWRLAEDR